MNKLSPITLILLVTLLISCKKSNLGENDYLIFGHFYGECWGERCVETFKLTDIKLFEDTTDSYQYQSPNNGGFVKLSNYKFKLVKDLTDYFPIKLFNESNTVFGCPDCADQGGLYIEYKKNGNIGHWTIDQRTRNVPDYLHKFIDKVNEKIELINK